jgi:NAD(P)-dependent dehydrogenase (short-subunit alcohol dehydrogenase family)
MYQNDETKNRICIVTGADSEIGRAAALMLARIGSTVVLVCRNREEGEKASKEIAAATLNNAVSAAECDFSSLSSVRAFADAFTSEYPWLDALIHNTADFDSVSAGPVLTESGTERVFTVNYLAPFLLTRLLTDWLKRGHTPRIIGTVPTGLAMYPRLAVEFDNLNGEKRFDPVHAYYQAKLAQVMFTYELARRLDDTKILPFCVRVPRERLGEDRFSAMPGFLKRLRRRKALASISANDTADTFVWLITSKEAQPLAGNCLDEKRRIMRTPKSTYDEEARRRLWDVSMRLTGLQAEAGKRAEKLTV